MTACFSLTRGDSPLLVSIPHDGRELAPEMAERMSEAGLELPDTDWHVRKLYEFSTTLGAGIIAANFSRYVVDLNRASSNESLYPGKVSTGLCPAQTFAGADIYLEGGEIGRDERLRRVADYWRPYHQAIEAELSRLREQFGYALLWDAHSIASMVPNLFSGELPQLNIGTSNGTSCDATLESAVADVATASSYSNVLNGRFTGGFITRNFGRPNDDVHAIQLELSQACYMDETTGEYDVAAAAELVATLEAMLAALLHRAAAVYGR